MLIWRSTGSGGRNLHIDESIKEGVSVDHNRVDMAHISSSDDADLPELPSMRLPTLSPALRASLPLESEFTIASLSPAPKNEGSHNHAKRTIGNTHGRHVEDEEGASEASESVFGDSHGSDTDYQPPGTKRPAKKSPNSSHAQSQKNTVTLNHSAVNEVPGKSLAGGINLQKARTNSRPIESAPRHKSGSSNGKMMATAKSRREVDRESGLMTAASAGRVELHPSSTRIKHTQEAARPNTSSSQAGNTTKKSQRKSSIKRVAKQQFFPISAPQPQQSNTKAEDSVFELSDSGPEPLVQTIPVQSKTSAVSNKMKQIPEVTRQNEIKAGSVKSQTKPSKARVHNGPNSKKKRSIVKYSSKSNVSRRHASVRSLNDVSEELARGNPFEERHTERHTEREPAEYDEPTREDSLMDLDKSSFYHDSEDDEGHMRGNQSAHMSTGEDPQMPDELSFKFSGPTNNDTALLVEISSDQSSESLDREEPASCQHTETEMATKQTPTYNSTPPSIPVGIKRVGNNETTGIPETVNGFRQKIQPNDGYEIQQEPIVSPSINSVDQTRRKKKIANHGGENIRSKQAKPVTSPNELRVDEGKGRSLNASSDPRRHQSQNARQMLAPSDSFMRLVGNGHVRVDPTVIATEQPLFTQQQSNRNSAGLFTIYEDLPTPSPVVIDNHGIPQRNADIPGHKVARPKVISSLIGDLGSPIQITKEQRPYPASTLQGHRQFTRAPLKDIGHLPSSDPPFPQGKRKSYAVNCTTTIPSPPKKEFQPRDRRGRETAADRLAGTLHEVAEVSLDLLFLLLILTCNTECFEASKNEGDSS